MLSVVLPAFLIVCRLLFLRGVGNITNVCLMSRHKSMALLFACKFVVYTTNLIQVSINTNECRRNTRTPLKASIL